MLTARGVAPSSAGKGVTNIMGNNYEPLAGETISETAREICRLATERGCPVSAKFNDTELIAQPGDEAGAIERAFWAESRRRSEEYARSPEGIASAKRQEESRRRAAES